MAPKAPVRQGEIPSNRQKNDCITLPLALYSRPRELEIAVGPPSISQLSNLDDPLTPLAGG